MNATLANASSFYINNNGAVRCVAHAGHYFGELYAVMPERNDYQTPCDTWDRVRSDFILLYVEEFGKAPECELCK